MNVHMEVRSMSVDGVDRKLPRAYVFTFGDHGCQDIIERVQTAGHAADKLIGRIRTTAIVVEMSLGEWLYVDNHEGILVNRKTLLEKDPSLANGLAPAMTTTFATYFPATNAICFEACYAEQNIHVETEVVNLTELENNLKLGVPTWRNTGKVTWRMEALAE